MARDVTFGIKLRADGSGFVGEVRMSGDELKKFGRTARETADEVSRAGDEMSGSLTKAAAVGTTIGTVLGQAIVGIARKLKDVSLDSISALDDLQERGQNLGILPEVLSSIELSGQAAGLGTGQLSASLTLLNRKIADAAAGGKRSSQIFRELGIEVRGANGEIRATDDVLRDLADRFTGYADGANKSAIAQELLGRGGAKMIAFLNEGREGLTKFAGASRESIEDAAKLQGEVDKLAAAWERWKLAMGGTLAGGINSTLAAISGDQENAPEKVLERLNTQIAKLKRDLQHTPGGTELFAVINIELKEAEERAGRLANLVSRNARALIYGDAGYGPKPDAPDITRPGKEGRARKGLTDDEVEYFRQLNEEIEEDVRQYKELEKARSDGARAAAALNQQTERELQTMKESNLRLREQNEEIGLSDRELDTLRATRLEHTIALLEENAARLDSIDGAQAEVAALRDKIALKKEELGLMRDGADGRQEVRNIAELERTRDKALEESKRDAEEVGRLLGNSMIDGFQKGENAGKNFVESLGAMITTRLAQKLTESLASGLGDLFKLFGSGSGGGGWSYGEGGAWGMTFSHAGGIAGGPGTFRRGVSGSAFGGARRMHGGGIAGLQGGEVPAILKRGEGVFTPEQMASMGGMGGIVVNIHDHAGVNVQAKQGNDGGAPSLEIIIEKIEGAIAGNISRGRGSVGQAIESRYGMRAAAR